MNEKKYILETKLEHRKNLGQFFTPKVVSKIMIDWITQNNPKNILDPAFGLGVFYESFKEKKYNNSEKFIGYEIDKNILSYLNFEDKKLKIKNEDYLLADNHKFDSIICNPPYMRFQKFKDRHKIIPILEDKIGIKLKGYSNTASIFLMKSIFELKKNGHLAFIMPYEFFNTGYGSEVKATLIKNGLLKHILIFSNEKEIFPDATTTICILLCKNDFQKEKIKIHSINSIDDIKSVENINIEYDFEINPIKLPNNKKWTPIISALFNSQNIPSGLKEISFYGNFKRGIATGANNYFALKKSDIKKHKIGKENYIGCITKSSHIKKPYFNENSFQGLFDDDKAISCLNITNPKDKNIINYLKKGEEEKIHERYLTKNRSPWYKLEERTPSPILAGVFNRGRIKFVRNYTSLINFTCFHSFYPNDKGNKYIDKLFIYLISNIGQSVIKINKRSYGGNLDKFEPGDLTTCLCPNEEQFDLIKDKDVSKIMLLIKNNDTQYLNLVNEVIDNALL